MKKILLVFGTRPEAIKMCPLVKELKSRRKWEIVVCVSGQHRHMLEEVLQAFQISPDYDLKVMKENQSLTDLTACVLKGVNQVLEIEHPALVLVHGDTTTAFAAALACFYQKIPIGHVEAGLRTYELSSPFPEEFNRQAIDSMARYCFAPTELARENLLRERKRSKYIFVTGNTGIDALQSTIRAEYAHSALEWGQGSRLLLVTMHRRENIGQPICNLFRALIRLLDMDSEVKVIYPMHPNPKIRALAQTELGKHERIRLIEPLEVVDFHNFMARCELIVTDSGGIQEEAPFLKKPVLVVRTTTERMEGVYAGTIRLVGTDEQTIYESLCDVLYDPVLYAQMAQAINPYGDGTASKQIADQLDVCLKEQGEI